MTARSKKQLMLGAALGLAAGTVLGYAVTEAGSSPLEKMVCGKLRRAQRCVTKWTKILGV